MQKKHFLYNNPDGFLSDNFIQRLKAKWLSCAPVYWWGDRLDVRFLAVKLLKNIYHQKILDLGCNAGVVLSEINSSNLAVGLDLSRRPLQIAKTVSPNSKLLCADMLKLPFKDNSFDTVIFLGMLELPDKNRKNNAINEIQRVLRAGGKLFLTTPNRIYLRAGRRSDYVSYAQLQLFLGGRFIFEIKGFNPFPEYPYFIPNIILAKIPFIWRFLIFLMETGIFRKISKSFFVFAEKK